MIRTNFLKTKLDKGQTTLGTWCVIDSPTVVDIISSCAGMDFVIIDAEHGPISLETAQHMVRACECYGVSPIMRWPEISESGILRVLDIGVHGIQIPHVSSRSDAERFVQFSHYPPKGTRGFSPYTKAGQYSAQNSEKIFKTSNENVLVIANIEGIEGLNNLADIVSVDGVDVYFIGLFDLSKSLGLPGQVDHPEVMCQFEKAKQIIKKAGKKVGTIARDLHMLKEFKKMGVDYLTYSVDTGMIKESYQKVIRAYRDED